MSDKPAAILEPAVEEALGVLRAEVQAMRIYVAQRRDGLLTHAEMLAMLEVYSEFGR